MFSTIHKQITLTEDLLSLDFDMDHQNEEINITVTVLLGTTDEEIKSIFAYPRGWKCTCQYDCCGCITAPSIRIKAENGIKTVTQRWSRSV